MPKSSTPLNGGRLSVLRRLDSSGERTHRQLIDCIRSKDTDALIEAIETGASSIDYMDDVGQTLLNWASAFGTQDHGRWLRLHMHSLTRHGIVKVRGRVGRLGQDH